MLRAAKLLILVFIATPAALRAQECDMTVGTRIWSKCSACHSLESKTQGAAAPSLKGIFGRPAGRMPGFSYSPALKNAKFVWDESSFDDFLANPQGKIPGTAMAFSGLRNPDDRKAIACYIRQNSLSPSASQTR
jgi:cytochrome c